MRWVQWGTIGKREGGVLMGRHRSVVSFLAGQHEAMVRVRRENRKKESGG
jgi:hypothetical protein